MYVTNEQLNGKSFDERLELLSEREREYFETMMPKQGVLYITSAPGLAKSSIARNIARVMDMQYMDVRLAMVDETDVGLFPTIQSVIIEKNGKIIYSTENDPNSIKVLDFVVPKWAVIANQRPTIIHFEELNRAPLTVRNAALQILLERAIGTEFKFNEGVYMLASGNLGDEDGTDVEEFDAALNNRLIHTPHDMPFEEWKINYALANIHPLIVQFLTNKSEYYNRKDGDKNNSDTPKAYATPRTWTFLSERLLIRNRAEQMGGKYDTGAIKYSCQKMAHRYVGASAASRFCKYLDETMEISLNDVLNNFVKIQEVLKTINRDRKSELLSQLGERNFKEFKPKHVANIIEFIKLLDEDERVAFITRITDSDNTGAKIREEPYRTILLSCGNLIEKIIKHSN